MPIRKRNITRRASLDSNAQAWLDGRCRESGFYQFKPDAELEALWAEHGDTDTMFWRRDMSLPITLEDLEARVEAWLDAGEDDKYGFSSYFVNKHYAANEKLKLWK